MKKVWNGIKAIWAFCGEKIIEGIMKCLTPKRVISFQVKALKKLKVRIEKSKNTVDDRLLPSLDATIEALENAPLTGL